MLFMYPSKKNIRHTQGLGLTDLMVGLAIGLLATLVIIKVAVLFEARRKSTTGIADAQMNASYALANLTRDVRMAGHGLGPSGALGCSVRRKLGTTLLPDLPLLPVTLIDGVNGAPDTLLVLSSGKAQSLTAAELIAPYAVGSDVMMVNSTLGMATGDRLLLYESGNTQCPLIVVNSIPIGEYRIRHSALPAGLLTATAYQDGAAVINLGAIHHQRYTINAKNQLLVGITMQELISGRGVRLHRMSLVCRRNWVMTHAPHFPARFVLHAGALPYSMQTLTVRQVMPMIFDVSWP